MNSEEGHAEWPRRAAATMAPHDMPLGRTPLDDGQHPTADEDSFWSRITSVSRRGFTLIRKFPGEIFVSSVKSEKLERIYGFLTLGEANVIKCVGKSLERAKHHLTTAEEGGGTPNPAGVATISPSPKTPETTDVTRTNTGSPAQQHYTMCYTVCYMESFV